MAIKEHGSRMAMGPWPKAMYVLHILVICWRESTNYSLKCGKISMTLQYYIIYIIVDGSLNSKNMTLKPVY